ncbi:MAG: phosphoribosylanthranilate isomerase [Candidatus Omnitrophica bacterium]|nr:phosphoribosylanthranilate isomerase [Candidatus Omnitrophota bacterium]
MVRVKICGITNLPDAQSAVQAGADALGFIFYKKSLRYISPSRAKKIISQLPPFITPVGVFVNEGSETIKKVAEYCFLRVVQLHGDESPSFCRKLHKYKIIKAVRVDGPVNKAALKRYQVAAVLFDTYQKNIFGGSGKSFNWSWVRPSKALKIPIILSGGLHSRNIKEAIKSVKPYAVDICSGVEQKPGKKSSRLIERLFKQIHSV